MRFVLTLILCSLVFVGGLVRDPDSASADLREPDAQGWGEFHKARASWSAAIGREWNLSRTNAIDSIPKHDSAQESEETDSAVIPLEDILSVLSSGNASEESAVLLRGWLETDFNAAAAWAFALPPEHAFRRQAFEQVGIAFHEADPAAALEWAQRAAGREEDRWAVLAIGYETARTDPLAALELALKCPVSSERDSLLKHGVAQWAELDSESAVQWVRQAGDLRLRATFMAAIAAALAEQNPHAAATLVSREIPPGREQEQAAVQVVQRWAQSAPEDAMQWVRQFPEASFRSGALHNLLSVWNAIDSSGAKDWFLKLPKGPERDVATSFFAAAVNP